MCLSSKMPYGHPLASGDDHYKRRTIKCQATLKSQASATKQHFLKTVAKPWSALKENHLLLGNPLVSGQYHKPHTSLSSLQATLDHQTSRGHCATNMHAGLPCLTLSQRPTYRTCSRREKCQKGCFTCSPRPIRKACVAQLTASRTVALQAKEPCGHHQQMVHCRHHRRRCMISVLLPLLE